MIFNDAWRVFSKKINGLKSILQYDDSLNLASNI